MVPKIRVLLTTPDRMRFVCFFLGHDWRPATSIDPTRLRFTCARCLALGEAST